MGESHFATAAEKLNDSPDIFIHEEMQSEKKILFRVMGGFVHTLLSTPFFFLGRNLPFGFIFLLFPIKVAEVCAQSRAQKKTWASCSTLSFRLLREKC